LDASQALLVSAKEGIGIPEVLEAIVKRIPPPKGDVNAPLQALIFDSVYDNYRGVISYVRLVNGSVKKGQNILFMATRKVYEVEEVGFFIPFMSPSEEIRAGEVGYVIANVKTLFEARVGDTITDANKPTDRPLPGYKHVKPVVFCGLFPVDRTTFRVCGRPSRSFS